MKISKSILIDIKKIISQSRANAVRQLECYRQLYKEFPNVNALRTQFSWTHYGLLIRVNDTDKREFYISEAVLLKQAKSRAKQI